MTAAPLRAEMTAIVGAPRRRTTTGTRPTASALKLVQSIIFAAIIWEAKALCFSRCVHIVFQITHLDIILCYDSCLSSCTYCGAVPTAAVQGILLLFSLFLVLPVVS